MTYSTLLYSLVVIFIFSGVIWPTFWFIRYRISRIEIYKPKNFILTKEESKRQEKILYRNLITNKLAGFKVITWVTLLTTTAVFLLNSLNYLHSLQLEIQDRRPWVLITTPQVRITEVGEKTESGNPLLISTYIENIGKTPAKYTSELVLKDSYPKIHISEEESPSGILFPGEKRRVGWLARWNNKDESISEWAREVRGPQILCVLCGVEIKIRYTSLGSVDDKYFTLSKLEWSQPSEGYVGRVEQSFRTLDAK